MKNYFLLILMVMSVVSCTNEELTEDPALENQLFEDLIQGLEADLSTDQNKNAEGSIDNPIVIADDAFILFTDYTFGFCNFEGEASYPYIGGGQFLSNITSGTSPALFIYRVTNQNCFLRTTEDTENEFKLATFYRIRGEVVQYFPDGLNLNNGREFVEEAWYRNVPGSNQIQQVNFFQDGSKTFGDPIDFPFLSNQDCNGLRSFPDGPFFITDFPSGTRVARDVANGPDYLYESNGIRLFFIGTCSSADNVPNPDICAGVEPFDGSRTYRRGDQVTYRGYLFTRLRRSWRIEGKCD